MTTLPPPGPARTGSVRARSVRAAPGYGAAVAVAGAGAARAGTSGAGVRIGVALLWAVGLGTTAVAPLFPHFTATTTDADLAAPLLGSGALALSQGVLLLVAGLAAVAVLLRLGTRATDGTVGALPGRHLALAAAAFALGPVLSGLFGRHGGLVVTAAFAPLLFAALHLSPRLPFARVLRILRVVLRCYVWGSLIAAVTAPAWAFLQPVAGARSRDYLGLEWGQLMGLSPNPNLLGPLAAAAFLLEVAPVARGRAWPVHAATALTAVVLTQSRTAWLCAGTVLLLHTAWRRVPARALLALLAAGAAGLLLLTTAPAQTALAQAATGRDYAQLNGRTRAWSLAYAEFARDPLLGYGPGLFGPAHRRTLFGTADSWIGQAHNQLMQTLGDSGLIGLTGLLLLLTALVVQARRTSPATRGLSTALVALLLVHCTSESPLRGLGGLSATVLLLTVVWCVLLHGSTPAPPDQESPCPPPAQR
ncbi:O-antigen ligase family protein [Streptomyces sp. NPDC050738]|uniref:O-antigen ligase family protein n=1 Tax=Streptomyces sp. NPDC050738 TaxID=3154744 RepID=UPI003439240F